MRIEWKKIHDRLGCDGCQHAEQWKIGKGACCNLLAEQLTDEIGRCMRRIDMATGKQGARE